MARQPVEAFDQAQQQVGAAGVLTAGQTTRPQLGQVAHRGPHLVGPQVRERLGQGVDLTGREAERRAHVADAVPGAVGVHHRHAGAALAAELLQDLLVDLGAPGGLDVDVDVGQLLAQRGQEPLHEQAVADRVDVGDAQQVGHETAGPAPPRCHPHAHVADEVHDVGDGEEVGGIAELGDHVELVVEPGAGGGVDHHRPAPETGLAAGPQDRLGLSAA